MNAEQKLEMMVARRYAQVNGSMQGLGDLGWINFAIQAGVALASKFMGKKLTKPQQHALSAVKKADKAIKDYKKSANETTRAALITAYNYAAQWNGKVANKIAAILNDAGVSAPAVSETASAAVTADDVPDSALQAALNATSQNGVALESAESQRLMKQAIADRVNGSSGLPSWVMPVALLGGAGLVAFLIMRKK